MTDKNAPMYLVPPDDPMINEWKHAFELFDNGTNDMLFSIEPDIIRDGEVAMLQQMVIALQHYPDLIEKMFLAVRLEFTMMEGLDIKLKEEEWKKDKKIYRWLYKMAESLPHVLFFMKDYDCRFYMLAGDMLANGELETKAIPGDKKHIKLSFNNKQFTKFVNRFYQSCWAILMYCHNTGFDPEKYIEAMHAELDMPFAMKDLMDQYRKDVITGYEFRVTPRNNT